MTVKSSEDNLYHTDCKSDNYKSDNCKSDNCKSDRKNTDRAFEGLLDGVICPFGSSFISFKRFENDFKSFQVSLVDH